LPFWDPFKKKKKLKLHCTVVVFVVVVAGADVIEPFTLLCHPQYNVLPLFSSLSHRQCSMFSSHLLSPFARFHVSTNNKEKTGTTITYRSKQAKKKFSSQQKTSREFNDLTKWKTYFSIKSEKLFSLTSLILIKYATNYYTFVRTTNTR